ncbi:MAG: class I SAM-dependent methyltransferase [Halobacteriota archaeon]
MKVKLGDIEETLFIPLWGRATISRQYPSLLNDVKAIELVEQMDYDFSTLNNKLRYGTNLLHAVRAKQIDDKIRAYLTEHPQASVIDLGTGLDTAFYRVDNGTLHWYDLDVPPVMTLRSTLLPAPERTTYLSASLFDPKWFAAITDVDNGVCIITAGVLMYFEESLVRTLFSSLADEFPGAEVVFDTQSRFAKLIGDWGLRRVGMHGSTTKWALKDAGRITGWDNRIVLLDQFPVFRDTPRAPAWSASTKLWMNFVDSHKMRNIVHLRV